MSGNSTQGTFSHGDDLSMFLEILSNKLCSIFSLVKHFCLNVLKPGASVDLRVGPLGQRCGENWESGVDSVYIFSGYRHCAGLQ